MISMFQFQDGTIKSITGLYVIPSQDGFNSKMVRLKAVSFSIPDSMRSFQFQDGTIKSSTKSL